MDAAISENTRDHAAEAPGARTTVSTAFARFAAGLELAQVPDELVAKAKAHMLDALGIALASTGFDYAGPILEGARKLGAGDQAHALGTGAPLPPAGAALVNGTLIHGLDFDDTHIGAIYHATAPALAAALATGEAANVSGKELLTAYIAGLEIGCRLGLAAGGGFRDRHFHPTALCGAFAASFVAGRLMGLDVATMVSACGLCGSMAAGILELEGSWLKRMHPGWAAHSGVSAAAIASCGFRGPATTFEGPRGFYQTHLGRIPTGDASPDQDLGTHWSIGGIALKPYPCCHFIHGFVDCALELRPKVKLEEIERIDCLIHKRILHMVGGPQRPSEPYAAMFSVAYTVALALITGKVDLAAFHDKGVKDAQILALAERAFCAEDPTSDFPVHFPGEVSITLKNGEVVSHRVATSLGTPERPLAVADIEAKFMDNATRVTSADAARALMQAVWSVETLGSVAELTRLCVTSGR